MAELKENVIEWLVGDRDVMCTLSQKKYVNRVLAMAKKHPERVEIIHENDDGSILARLPLAAVHLTIYSANNLDSWRDGGADG